MKWCPKCDNYLYHDIKTGDLVRLCRKCNYSEKDEQGGLVVETRIQDKASEGYKIIVNEFTTQDPTLPQVQNIKCPNHACPSNAGNEKSDVIYIKDDVINLKYTYICTYETCKFQWRSRS
jgi:DNA-directed RNA polymerase subunit M/transcription elongation factor TFIIS